MSATDTMILPPSTPAGDGGMQNVASLLTSGTYQDVSGHSCTIYPDWAPWPYPHYQVYPQVHTHVTTPAQEKPHEVVQRALKEISGATRALRDSAAAMGVPVDAGVLEEAIVRKLHEALAR